MKPKIVKQIINTDTNAVTNIEDEEIRQVISSETASKMLDMMESVVTEGTGSSGAVKGYSVGGKTGTSEPPAEDKDFGYVASFVAVSPAENPEIVILVALYDPQVKNYHGGTVAGPVVSNILSEVLPYLGITTDKIDVSNKSTVSTVTVPNVENKTVAEAQKVLTNSGFRSMYTLSGNKNEVLVTDQVPSAGTELPSNSLVMLYTEENNVRTSTTVPNLSGMTVSQAASSIKAKNLNITTEGSGTVISQEPAARYIC
jgi:stage V sporulation protein D (sporulation-specific penicillin-binding protein)